MVLWSCGGGGRGEQASWLGDWDDLMDWVSGAVSGGYFDITCGVRTAKYCIGVDDYARAVGELYLSALTY